MIAPLARADDVKIPYQKTTLKNGLVVVLAEDHTLPRVAVNVTYRVGSSVEPVGRTGFAHLFEHLMFMGTSNAPRGMFDAWMEQAGGRNNAWTSEDRTDYCDVAPANALPLLLWLEADRMKNLGPQIDQGKLDLQREVVLNERRRRIENQPYGVEDLTLPRLLWPEATPYHHPVIGSPEDMRAATVREVKAFFAQWYAPADASLVVAGDFDARAVSGEIERWFGDIPGRPAPTHDETRARAADLPSPPFGVVRETVRDAVDLAKVTLAWQSPPHFAVGDAEMDLVASVLARGTESRLYRSLVYEQKIAQSVSAEQQSHVLGSAFVVEALVRPGVSPARVEKALFDEIAALRERGVTSEELERARSGYEVSFVDRMQDLATRASLLNLYQAELGDPGFVQHDLDRYRGAGADGLLSAVRTVLLPQAVAVLTILPRKGGGS